MTQKKEVLNGIFTVADTENCCKPIVYALPIHFETFIYDQEEAEKIMKKYLKKNKDIVLDHQELEDLTYCVRKEGYGYHDERWCFEVTELQKVK